LVREVRLRTQDWAYEAVSIGYPGRVVHQRIISEPVHLASGWIGFDFGEAFGRPVQIVNDAAMQALGNYDGGRLLFLGLGTGLGSAMIVDGQMEPMELAHLPYKKGRTYEDYVGMAGLKRLGLKKWRKNVWKVVELLGKALEPDSVVVGGGNALKLEAPPVGVRLGDNAAALNGGFRLWQDKRQREGHRSDR
jgi:polyphosphate glucokinase